MAALLFYPNQSEMKRIALGVFNISFYAFAKQFNAESYPFRDLMDNEFMRGSVVDHVRGALERCDECYFLLNYLYFPIKVDSFERVPWTHKELELIECDPILLAKTKFYIFTNADYEEIDLVLYKQKYTT